MVYYNAIVFTDYNAKIKYHEITNIHSFIDYVQKNISVVTIMFYRKQSRHDKLGVYCGFWSQKKGLNFS